MLIPIPALQKAGSYTLSVLFDTKEAFSRKIVIRARKFDKVVLGIPEDLGLTTGGLLTKLSEQKVSIDSVVKNETPKVYFDRAFGLPLYDNSKITSTFGEVSISLIEAVAFSFPLTVNVYSPGVEGAETRL
ncbi:MAG: hypothetical protein WCP55_07025 [Lentisphaerota bacterium]